MSPKLSRLRLQDGSFVDGSIEQIVPDQWRPHGIRYRLAWIQAGKCRVLFDNHHGKSDHYHVDGEEFPYVFRSLDKLTSDFIKEIQKLGGPI